MLNVEQILEQGLLKLENTKGKPAQVGYDLSLKAVQKIGNRIGGNFIVDGKIGKILKDSTELTNYTPFPLTQLDGVSGWLLHTGVYDITFNELKLDSMDIAALMLEVEEAYGKKISGTKLHELNSINRLTDFINAE